MTVNVGGSTFYGSTSGSSVQVIAGTGGGNYTLRCAVTDSCGTPQTCNADSASVSITTGVTPSVTATADPGTTVCAGTTVTFTAHPTNGGSPTYDWYYNDESEDFDPIAHGVTYGPVSVANNDKIHVKMHATGCASPNWAVSDTINMTVEAATAGGTASYSGGNVCFGASVEIDLSGQNGSIQWQFATGTGVSWANVGGATASSLITNVFSGTNNFRAILTGTTCPQATSTVAQVYLNPRPTAFITGPAPVCAGTTNDYSATGGVDPSDTYTWAITSSDSSASLDTSSGPTVAVSSVTATNYQLILTATGTNTCVRVVTNAAVAVNSVVPAVAPLSENFGTLNGVYPFDGWTATTGDGTIFWSNTTSTASSGYAGASGGAHVTITQNASTNAYLISPTVDMTGLTASTVSMGVRKSGTFTNSVLVDVSTDGGTTFTEGVAAITKVNALADSNYHLLSLDLSSVADNQAQVVVRWHLADPAGVAYNAGGTLGMDDVKLTGTSASAAISPAGPITSCAPVALSATRGISYLWSPNGETAQSIIATNTGSYSVAITYANGCPAAAAPVSVTVGGSAPSCSISGADGPFCPNTAGHTYSSDTTGPTLAYSWSIDGNGSIVGSTTDSSVSVTAGSMCSSNFTLHLQVVDTSICTTSTCEKADESVADSTGPVLSGCPSDASYSCISAVPAAATVTASDNCDGVITPSFSEHQSNPGSSCNNTITRIWAVGDGCGNSNTCTQIITVNDTTVPTVTCPADITVNAPDATVVTYTTPSGSDNCTGSPSVNCVPASGSSFNIGHTLVTCTALDACGNSGTCTFNVIINQTCNPTINGLSNTNIDTCQEVLVVTWPVPTTTTHCGALPNSALAVACTPKSGSKFNPGATPVTCITKADSLKRIGTNTFTVTVNSTLQPPTIDQADVVSNTCMETLKCTYAPVMTTYCGVLGKLVCAPKSGTVFLPGVTPVTCVATDKMKPTALVTTNVFNVTVNSTLQPPTIDQADVVTNTCQETAKVAYAPVMTTYCNLLGKLVCAPKSGTVFLPGTSQVTCVATDKMKPTPLITTNVFNVTVNSTLLPPTINNATDITTNTCAAVVKVAYTPTATGYCGTTAKVVCSPLSKSVFSVGTHPVTCVATDGLKPVPLVTTNTFNVTVSCP
jgi:hypothetical protein